MLSNSDIWMLKSFINHMPWIIIMVAVTTNRCMVYLLARFEVSFVFNVLPTSGSHCHFPQWLPKASVEQEREFLSGGGEKSLDSWYKTELIGFMKEQI